MAKIRPPKRKTKGMPPPANRPTANLTKEETGTLRPLNFKVPALFHRDFKSYAVLHDMSMLKLLKRCFEEYKDNHA